MYEGSSAARARERHLADGDSFMGPAYGLMANGDMWSRAAVAARRSLCIPESKKGNQTVK
jgi:hypothetical protein